MDEPGPGGRHCPCLPRCGGGRQRRPVDSYAAGIGPLIGLLLRYGGRSSFWRELRRLVGGPVSTFARPHPLQRFRPACERPPPVSHLRLADPSLGAIRSAYDDAPRLTPSARIEDGPSLRAAQR